MTKVQATGAMMAMGIRPIVLNAPRSSPNITLELRAFRLCNLVTLRGSRPLWNIDDLGQPTVDPLYAQKSRLSVCETLT
jgi:hypothetical protein